MEIVTNSSVVLLAPPASRARRCGMRPVEFLLCPGADLVQFRVKPSDLGIELDKIQTLRSNSDRLFSFHASINLATAVRRADAGRGVPSSRVALLIQQIKS